MPRAGRPEQPLTANGPLAKFASGLRALRAKKGITYRDMAYLANYGVTALSVAANGRTLPTLEITLAYVSACDGCEEDWRSRWYQTRDLLNGGSGEAHE